ncbi:unnamed protein product [Amoebophrya sp. A25]|nr:unnamed protein product [Amoebophrya sp. A25]|eukprot:GSA25T00021152001.1
MPPRLQFSVDVDAEDTVSMTWNVSADGSIEHKPSGMKISHDGGVQMDGQQYKLSPADIELDGDMLGHGAGGIVQKGVHKPTGTPVAIKTIKVDAKAKKEQMLNEIRGLINAQGCPQLVQWYAAFVAKNTGAVHVALELMDRGSLADIKKKLPAEVTGVPEKILGSIARDVLLGLAHLHGKKKMLHRDIKPENILMNAKGEVKLTDFGISRDLNSTVAMAATFVGTATYMSPERALGQDYGYGSDIWSVGMVIYELATRTYPFPSITSFPVLFDYLCTRDEPRLDKEKYSPELCEFIEKSLVRDTSQRQGADNLLELPWVKNAASNEEVAKWLVEMGFTG